MLIRGKYKEDDLPKNEFRTPPAEPIPDEQQAPPFEPDVAEPTTVKPSPKTKPKTKAEKPQKEENQLPWYKGIAAFFADSRTHSITGLLMVLSSFYFLLAFVSWYFNQITDADKVSGPAIAFLTDRSLQAANWTGKLGALAAHFFLYRLTGIGSFMWLVPLFVTGFYLLFKVTLFPLQRTFWHCLFLSLWLSLSSAFLFGNSIFLGGGFGYHSNLLLVELIGTPGLGMLLAFSIFSYLIFTLNPSLAGVSSWIKEWQEAREAAAIKAQETKQSVKKQALDEEQEEEEEDLSEEEMKDVRFTVTTADESKANILNENKVKEKTFTAEPVQERETKKEEFTFTIVNKELLEEEKTEEITEEQAADANHTEEVPTENPTRIEPDVVNTKEFNPEPMGDAANAAVSAESPEEIAARMVAMYGAFDPKLELSDYKMPSTELLFDYDHSKGVSVTKEELIANSNEIVEKLKDYGIEISDIRATIGPTVTLYEIIPAAGIRISKIKNLEDDIAMALKALGIRIIAPMPGKGTVGIEIPNKKPEIVPMKSLLTSEEFTTTNKDLPIALGKTISNEVFVADLAKMPHLLMAGATGQGKSVGLNAILVSLLYKKHPSELKLVLVDPKKVELNLYALIERHYLAKLPDAEEAIITDTKKVIHTLNSLCIEMDNRYMLLKDAQVRNIKEYNDKFCNRRLNPNDGHQFLPYIVLVVDEFADLIMTAGKEVEQPIARLAQLARAIGIHLIIATQRPSVNIITGTIKANFPARIAFRVSSPIDSRTILDSTGANQLIGRGDMLLSTGNDVIRLQCAFVDTPELDKLTKFIGSQRGYSTAFSLPEYAGEGGNDDVSFDAGELDSLFEDAARIVVSTQQGSTSLLQRKLKLGHNRAGRLIDQLEQTGVIGPYEGSKARQVLIKDEMSLEAIIQRAKGF